MRSCSSLASQHRADISRSHQVARSVYRPIGPATVPKRSLMLDQTIQAFEGTGCFTPDG